jgi:hypothetical protein
MHVDIGEPAFLDIEEAHADRGADPFVQVEADQVGAEIGDVEGDLAPGMARSKSVRLAARTRSRGTWLCRRAVC